MIPLERQTLPADGLLRETLVHDDRWLRGLATRLVRDPGTADDVVQQTWTARLQKTGSVGRPWLFTVLKNRLRLEQRSLVRRARREAVAAQSDAQESSAETVERIETRQRLVQAVLAISEPNRTTLLLRFYEDLPPREIAKRMKVPVSTVKTRLQRALEALRSRLLAERGGSRRAFVASLGSFIEKPASAALGVILMSLPVKIILGVSTVAVAVLLWTAGDDPPSQEPASQRESASALQEPRPIQAPIKEPVTRSALESQVVAEAESAAVDPTPPAGAPWWVEGLVVDMNGTPLADQIVIGVPHFIGHFDPAKALRANELGRAISGVDGAFRIELPRGSANLVCAREDWITVYAGSVSPRVEAPRPVIVASRHREVSGYVVDEHGGGVEGAKVDFKLPFSSDTPIDAILDLSERQRWSVRTDVTGLFTFPSVPAHMNSELAAHHAGYNESKLTLEDGDLRSLRVVLERPALREGLLQGEVIDEEGTRVAGAMVVHGFASVTTDPNGFFEIEVDGAGSRDGSVRALKKGHAPGVVERAASGFPDYLVLRLGPPTLEIGGIVMDADGSPKEGVLLGIVDAEVFGAVSQAIQTVEALSGRTGDQVDTTDDGRFLIDGLLDRDYELFALDVETLVEVRVTCAAGSKDVRITLGRELIRGDLSGRVIDRHGQPVKDALVAVGRNLPDRVYLGGTNSEVRIGRGVRTSTEGRFLLREVPAAGVAIHVNGDHVIPRDVPTGDADELEIEVSLRCHFRVEVSGSVATGFHVEDEHGIKLMMTSFRGSSIKNTQWGSLKDGASPVFAVPDTVRAVCLKTDDGEVTKRIPVDLVAGEITVVTAPD